LFGILPGNGFLLAKTMKPQSEPQLCSSLFLLEKIEEYCAEVREKNSHIHQHDFYSVYWITHGEAMHTTPYVEYQVPERSIFFVPSELKHSMNLCSSATGIGIMFNKSFFRLHDNEDFSILNSPLFINPDYRTIINLNDDSEIYFQRIISLLVDEKNHENHYQKMKLVNLLRVFLYESLRIFEQQHKVAEDIPENQQHLQIIEFKRLIETYFREAKDVAFYADKMNLRPATLNQLTRNLTGITAGELIRDRVIEQAKKMLYSTTSSHKEIAEALGFDDPAYFSRFFKKYTDLTLSEFRDLIQKKN
jgi:AraC family transcriptional regulator, transcriptional activator of pobA